VGISGITAQFTGNIFFKGSTSSPFGQSVTPGTVTIALAGGGTSFFGQTVTFTATLTPPLLPPQIAGPTGTVTFRDGSALLGSGAVVQSGSGASTTYTATFSSATLAVGSHPSITATYNADPNWNVSGPSNAVSLNVSAAVATASLTTSVPGPITPGQSITLTVAVSGNSVAPTGLVWFLDGTTVLGSQPLSSGSASLATTSLAPGSHQLSATYLVHAVYAATGSNTVTLQVTPGTVGITLAGGGSSVFGQSVSFTATLTLPLPPPQIAGPTGSITFRDGSSILGSATVAPSSSGGVVTYTATFSTAALAVGAHPSITATYNGDANWNVSGPSNAVSQNVAAAVASATLTPSVPGPIAPGQSITLTVSVTGNSIPPTGTVLFLDGTAVLGSQPLTNGSAGLTTNSLAPGGYQLIAT